MEFIPRSCLLLLMLCPALVVSAQAAETTWTDLFAGKDLDAWKEPHGEWFVAEDVELDAKNPKMLAARPGTGVLVNGPKGRTSNLLTKQKFTDIELHAEFCIPKKSNSGIKFQGQYEIQIFDSYGVKEPKGSDCGGIYPRAEQNPSYHYLDDGKPPRVNAAKPAGEWQTLDAIFLAPRFGADGKKAASARFVKVILNGQVIHEDVEVQTPTGAAWHDKESASGPLLLQADHGPVAFRNLRVRPYVAEAKKE